MKQSTGLPTKFVEAFGANAAAGMIRAIPTASQIGIVNGAASLNDGFPPLTATQLASGGVPPSIQDFNGILNQATAWNLWTAAAGLAPWDSAFSAAVGGYPYQALVTSNTTVGRVWVSTADNNTVNPDSPGQTAWLALMLASDVLALIQSSTRTRPPGNVDLYINASTGSDSNPGTSSLPFLTRQAAVNYAQQTYDVINRTLTFHCTGNFADTLFVNGPFLGQSSPASVIFDGGGTATVSGAASCFYGGANSTFTIQNFGALASSGSAGTQGTAISATAYAIINYKNVNFAQCANAHQQAQAGGQITNVGNYTISGTSPKHISILDKASSINYASTTVVSIPSSSIGFTTFAYVLGGTLGIPSASVTFSGTVGGGARYFIDNFGVIATNGGGANYLPGTTAGSINGTYGEYQ